MRRVERSMGTSLARSLFAEAPCVSMASRTPDGAPVLRTLDVVVLDEPDGFSLAFHGAPAGEKVACVGQPAVLGCERVVVSIPSWFSGPERACPASTWYLSAQAHGTLDAVEDIDERARILQALMALRQPEGRHRPITATDPMYAAAVRNLLVVRLRPTRVSAKASVGQEKPPEVRHAVLRCLWERGDPTDVAAIVTALRFAPEPWPDWLRGPGGTRLHVGPGGFGAAAGPAEDDMVRLLEGAERGAAHTEAQLRRSLRGGSALVAATDGDGVVGVARAVSDGGEFAFLANVFVREDRRGQGIGDALARLLLDHPAVRGCARVLLHTRTAEGFWARHGFRAFATVDGRAWMAR